MSDRGYDTVSRWGSILITWLLLGLLALPGLAHDQRVKAATLTAAACTATTAPYAVWVVNAASESSCDSADDSTYQSHCCCANGAWASCGGGGGSITAGDGTTTVNPASTLTFDPTYFDVTDEGSGEAGITFIGSAGGGNVYVGTTPSFDNEPPSPSAYDDEFNDGSLNPKWTIGSSGTTNAATSGTIDYTASLTTPIVDEATMDGYVAFQSDNSTGQTFWIRQSYSPSTDATFFYKVGASNQNVSANGETNVVVRLTNSADSNEAIAFGVTHSGSGVGVFIAAINNGSVSTVTGALLSETTVRSPYYIVCWKKSDVYYLGAASGTGAFTYYGSVTKTGVTTFDQQQIEMTTANETPSAIEAVDFYRYKASLDYGLANAPSTQGTDIAPYGQYDPDNQATSLGTSGWREEWSGDAASQTWAWGNQDSATETIDNDAALLAGDGTDEFHARCTTAVATNADQTVTAKVWVENLANTNNGAGIGVVIAGTVATPTALEVLYYQNASSDGYLFLGMTSWTLAGASAHGSVETFWPIYSVTQVPTYFQLRYTDSSRNLDAWISFDGLVFRQVGSSTTISADPVAWCYLVRDDGDAVVEWIQNRTDTNRNNAGE